MKSLISPRIVSLIVAIAFAAALPAASAADEQRAAQSAETKIAVSSLPIWISYPEELPDGLKGNADVCSIHDDESTASDDSAWEKDESAAGLCDPGRFPSGVGHPISCCQDGNRAWHTLDGRTLGFRVFANACTEADGEGTSCIGIECVYGPCGARIEWAVTAEEVHVFRPDSRPDKCGWAVKKVVSCVRGCDWPAGADRAYPEPFEDQEEYPGLTATCPYRGCLLGGIPVP